jgi:CubicO group peptidase (beta-lactamase class C family)
LDVVGKFAGARCSALARVFIVLTAMLHNWWRPSLAPKRDGAAFAAAVQETIDGKLAGKISFILLESGAIAAEYHASIDPREEITRHTLFQVGSLSKWVSAWGVLLLAERGEIDLDAPVVQYLSRWQLPESEFDNHKVTVRRLLSHSAGLGDSLGYQGFTDPAEVQSLEASLTRSADPAPHAQAETRVGHEPGTRWQYSGGGYTILQLLVEEISGLNFNDYMQQEVLQPIGMHRASAGHAVRHPDLRTGCGTLHAVYRWRHARRSR